ncbi:MAG TPA: hypothetical protein VEI97_19085 [bacterium]|nr:hypothetical protein [bacterium]
MTSRELKEFGTGLLLVLVGIVVMALVLPWALLLVDWVAGYWFRYTIWVIDLASTPAAR